MKKMILLAAALFCAALCGAVMAAEKAGTPQLTILKEDSGGNLSQMNITPYTVATDFGLDAYSVGAAVKFTPPKPGWKLTGVQVFGWTGLNKTSKTLPTPQEFLLEIRDKDLNLLYRMIDTQNAYFTFPNPIVRLLEIPALTMNGDFYVIFYDRGAMVIGAEMMNGTGHSYFFDNRNTSLVGPVEFVSPDTNKSITVNWILRAVGE